MQCKKCNFEIDDVANFCPICGTSVEDIKPKNAKKKAERVSMKCKRCDGTMVVGKEKTILTCPYCGAQEMIPESDDVIIERMKNETYRDVEEKRIKHEKEMNKHVAFKRSKLSKLIIVFMIITLLFAAVGLSSGGDRLLGGIIALTQTVFFMLAWLMGKGAIKTQTENLYAIFSTIAFLLFIPFLIFL